MAPLVLLAPVVLLSGCLQMVLHITLDFSGASLLVYRVGADRAIAGAPGRQDADASQLRQAAERQGFAASEYSDGSFTGLQFEKRFDTIEEMLRSSDLSWAGREGRAGLESLLHATTIEDGLFWQTIRCRHEIDADVLSGPGGETRGRNGDDAARSEVEQRVAREMRAALLRGLDVRFILTLPVRPREHDATEQRDDGRTLEWRVEAGRPRTMLFEARLPRRDRIFAATALLALVLGSVTFVVRRPRDGERFAGRAARAFLPAVLPSGLLAAAILLDVEGRIRAAATPSSSETAATDPAEPHARETTMDDFMRALEEADARNEREAVELAWGQEVRVGPLALTPVAHARMPRILLGTEDRPPRLEEGMGSVLLVRVANPTRDQVLPLFVRVEHAVDDAGARCGLRLDDDECLGQMPLYGELRPGECEDVLLFAHAPERSDATTMQWSFSLQTGEFLQLARVRASHPLSSEHDVAAILDMLAIHAGEDETLLGLVDEVAERMAHGARER